ncbi:MAG: hypothetical protein HQK55_15260, partial [Deltaproteobacteria bacterium]|nr:hypothetical protein [Deltaproteobacteria bacterium]
RFSLPPRKVITDANALLNEILYGEKLLPPPSPEKIIQEALETKYQEIISNFEDFGPDEGRLTLAVELYLKNRPDHYPYKIIDLNPTIGQVRYIDLEGQIKTDDAAISKTAFLIDVDLHHRAVGASLKRGVDHLTTYGPKAKALFIRDARCLFPEPPKWQKTNELLQEFKTKQGAAFFLDRESAARWYALALLQFSIVAGDITDEKAQPLTFQQYIEVIKTMTSGEFYSAFEGLDKYLAGVNIKPVKEQGQAPNSTKKPHVATAINDEDAWLEKLHSASGKIMNSNDDLAVFIENRLLTPAWDILGKTPGWMMKSDLLANHVSQAAKLKLETDQLLIVLSRHKELFSFISAKNGLIIKRKAGAAL